jgi:uncharacterized membrane protein YgdD (TMEM256/DUF423 family)
MNATSIKDYLSNALQWAESGSKLTYASIAIGLLVGLILFRLFFKNIAGFFHCIGFCLGSTPNASGAAQPGLSRWSRLKLLAGTLLPAGSGYAAYILLPRWFPALFH